VEVSQSIGVDTHCAAVKYVELARSCSKKR